MSTIPQIRTAIGAALTETLPYLAVAQEWGDKINVSGNRSVAVVEKGPTTYDSVMDGQGDTLSFTITVLVSKASDRTGRDKLDAFCDPDPASETSIRNAVNGRLGDLVAMATVASDSEYREYEVPPGSELKYLGCEFVVQVET